MQVKVKLLGILSFTYPAFSKFRYVEIEKGETVRDLQERLGLPVNEVHFISVNGKMVEEDYVLSDKDEVIFFPNVSGG
ncbi:MoaD/ThiS family protein [Carboxydothermus pertinax]|uniref:Molybdopterin synthase sulfur carrier subunit n=1 Tax=Carboxydothermus pertinax TaxID=870242 RepID=A0A1L8CXC0_9THEO|nr:MoaD/ThiS family protein [Carboxydothermus pertinax]GAV23550.1 hypothetical protein cpu_20600 [Carboxydothermus pertinax]